MKTFTERKEDLFKAFNSDLMRYMEAPEEIDAARDKISTLAGCKENSMLYMMIVGYLIGISSNLNERA